MAFQIHGEYSGIEAWDGDWKGYKLKHMERTFTVEEPFKIYPNKGRVDIRRREKTRHDCQWILSGREEVIIVEEL